MSTPPPDPIVIPNWDARFETAQSRKVAAITWTPLKHSFATTLRMHPPEVAAAMMQVVLLAATMPKRGVLHDGAHALTPESIGLCVGTPSEVVAKALSALGADYQRATTALSTEGRKEGSREGRRRGKEGGDGQADVAHSATVDAVIAHYKTFHPRARPGDKERAKIRKRLREGYSLQDLIDAIDGCHRSPHHCGDNDRGTKYQSLELIVRDSAHVQQFIDVPENGSVRRPSRRLAEAQRVGQNWLDMTKGQECEKKTDPPLLG